VKRALATFIVVALAGPSRGLANAPVSALISNEACPAARPGDGVTVEVLTTGFVESDWSLVVNTGKKGLARLPLLVGKINHPTGTVLVDAGLGQTTRDGSFPRFPLKDQSTRLPKGWTIAERLTKAPRMVLMTHLHYDHVGGLFDLPGVEVWTTEAEWRTTMTSNVGFPESRIRDAVNWRVVPLRAGRARAILGRPAHDVLGDGSIWYISTPGHTPGGASVLVIAEDGPWLFAGDIAWVDAHLSGARRPWLVSLVVDGRPRELQRSAAWLQDLKTRCPELKVVNGHEPRWAQSLPELENGETNR
jgi:N-acyl homoserine lactone hydrolase